MSRKNQNSRIQFKYSTIAGVEPTLAPSMDHTDGTWSPTDLYVGEFFLNAVDNKMWVRTLTGIVPITSGTTSINISQFVNKSGDTMTGTLYLPSLSATTDIITPYIYSDIFSGGTYYGDGSNLTNIPYTTFTGGTVNGYTTFTDGVDFTSASVSANTINTTGNLQFTNGDIEVAGGSVTALTYYGDGSNLTGLNISGFTGYWDLEPINENSIKTTFGSNSFVGSPEYSIIGGKFNTLRDSDHSILLGLKNEATSSPQSHILASSSVIQSGSTYSSIFGGDGHSLKGNASSIFGGNKNKIVDNNFSTIVGGNYNTLSASTVSNYNTIIGGQYNTIEGNELRNNAIVGGEYNFIGTGVTGSVILGGTGLTATNDDTTYVPKLNINDVPTGSSVNNLGIDVDGNVVVGSGGASTPDLKQVLVAGNLTSGNDIITTNGDYIGSDPSSFSRSNIQFNTNNLFFEAYNSVLSDPDYGSKSIELHTTGITISNGLGTFRGVEYGGDYSSNYTNRSLVDKEYVDNAVSGSGYVDGGGSSGQITYWSDADTITGSSRFTYAELPIYVFTDLKHNDYNYQQSYITSSTNQILQNSEGSVNRVRLQTYNNTSSSCPKFDLVRVRGTVPSPAPIELGDDIGQIQFLGSYQSSSITTGVEMIASASEDWDTNNTGTEFNIKKHNNGDSQSTPLNTVFQIDGDGNTSFGNNRVSTLKQYKAGTNTTGVISSNSFDYDCDGGMTQYLDMNAATSASTITFSNQQEGTTYSLIVRQRAGGYNLVFPTGWWLDTSAFDFTTLATDERAIVTMTYLDSEWYFAGKKLTQI